MYRALLEIYSPPEAERWLVMEQSALGNKRPCELIETPAGHARVCAYLAQVTEGLGG